MAILVDFLQPYDDGYWSHLACESGDDLEELHTFAQSIGLRRDWFQNHRLIPHYDLKPRLRRAAVAAGAEQVGVLEFCDRCRRDGKAKS